MPDLELKSAASEYLEAMGTVRIVKSVAWLAVWVVLAAQVTCFVLVQFAGFLEPLKGAALPARSQPASGPATAPAIAPAPGPAASAQTALYMREGALSSILSASKFLGPVAGLLLSVSLGVGLLLSLVGRLGGAKGFTSALFWSIVLLGTLVPWQQVLPGLLGVGVLTDLPEMRWAVRAVRPDWAAGRYGSPAMILHYVRFLAYPAIALVVWVLVGLKFARALRQVHKTGALPAAALR